MDRSSAVDLNFSKLFNHVVRRLDVTWRRRVCAAFQIQVNSMDRLTVHLILIMVIVRSRLNKMSDRDVQGIFTGEGQISASYTDYTCVTD